MLTKFLVKHFVKEYEQIEQAAVRTRYGLMASVVGICCNLVLFAVKFFIGVLMRSISVMADAFNNLSDAASSVISFVGVKMAEKPADEEHPFGHGRMEYIAAFVVAFLVIQVGFSLLKTSVGHMIVPEKLAFQPVSAAVLFLSIGVKLWLGLFNRALGKRIDSSVMLAASADSFGDVCATSATLFSIVVYGIWQVNLDGIVGIAVSILVILAGINIAKDTLAPLIGEPIDAKEYQKITEFVERYDGIVGSHDLIVHNYGPRHRMASIHAEVPNDVDIEVSHAIVDRIERDALAKLGLHLVIHMDPLELKDGRVGTMKELANQVIQSLDSRLSLHDFRVVEKPEKIYLIFDLAVPREYTTSMREALKEEVCVQMRAQEPRCDCRITVESTYQTETMR